VRRPSDIPFLLGGARVPAADSPRPAPANCLGSCAPRSCALPTATVRRLTYPGSTTTNPSPKPPPTRSPRSKPATWTDGGHDEREATWRERALNAEDALKAAHAEILTQRIRIGELLGQVSDLQADWTEEAIQRITTENTTLKRRVRQLTADNRTVDERLKAARCNLRFQDRRVADLVAQIADPSKAK
jgi:hypothetical protein